MKSLVNSDFDGFYLSVNNRLLLFLSIASFFFASCDPARFLIIENKDNGNSEIVFNFHEIDKSKYGLLTAERDSIVVVKYVNDQTEPITFRDDTTNTITIEFSKDKKYSKVTLLFGWGTWSDSLLYDFSGLIRSIRITKNGHTEIFEEKEEIYRLLLNNRKQGKIVFNL